MRELLVHLSSAVGGLMIIITLFRDHFPPQLRELLDRYSSKFFRLLNPYVQITFHEYTGEWFKKSDIYIDIQNYLTGKATTDAKKLKANTLKDSQSLVLSMDDNEEVTDMFQGAKVWWSSKKIVPRNMSMSIYPATDDRRYYKLTFHKSNRDLINDKYIKHIVKTGKEIARKNRQRKLFTNNPSQNWHGYKSTKWSHIVFEHPSTFDTLAMDQKKKLEIMNDLVKFSQGKDYYNKIGKAWKRGYLLHGPPGTGKSSMIAAIANFMNYDVYDLELTTVKDNSELRKLLIDTTSKSIIVIEDIDCSLDLTGQRKESEDGEDDDEDEEGKGDPVKKAKKKKKSKESKVTLSGLLNFIDGIWSACGSERIIIFTTNFIDKLDPALIRRGRMDKHIEMSYCCYDAFKVLANNYLDIEYHPLFEDIETRLKDTKMTPADVAENLMPKLGLDDMETCLKSLIEALNEAKEEAIKKAKEEEEEIKKAKEEEEAKKKAEEEEKSRKSAPKDGEAKPTENVKENGVVANGESEEGKGEVKENGVVN